MKRTKPMIIAFLISAAACLFCLRAFAAEDVAVLSYAQGDVKVKYNDESSWDKYELNATLQVGDSIKTGANSKARIVLEDGASLLIGPLSMFTISSVTIDDATEKQNASFSLDSGKVRSNVNKLGTAGSTFEVKTPTAVAGVRGTDFMVEIDPDTEDSDVTVFDGEVEFGSPQEARESRVRIGKDQGARIGRGGRPGKPEKINRERIERKMREMSKAQKEDDPTVAEGLADDGAEAVLATKRSMISEARKNALMQQIKSGDIPPGQVKEVVRLTRRGINPEQAERILSIIDERDMTDDEVREFAQRMRGLKNREEMKNAFAEFEKKALKKKKRLKKRKADAEVTPPADNKPPAQGNKFKKGKKNK